MPAATILNNDLFKKCVEFHGHLCPGLTMGYQAAMAGMDWHAAHRAEDEEMVTIVETDACSADAVQVITGCTFGKGNFIFQDHGKFAFTFLSRKSGKGVRVARKADPGKVDFADSNGLRAKVMGGTATPEERAEFKNSHEAAAHRILEQSPEELFNITEVELTLPARARVEPSVNCVRCKEPVMGSKLETIDGRQLCRACQASLGQ